MNKGTQPRGEGHLPAESVEPRGLAEGNTQGSPTAETQSPGKVSRGLLGVREAARRDKKLQFTALLHHIDVGLLQSSYYHLKRQAAPGVDGLCWGDYQEGLMTRLTDLHRRIHRGSYRARPSKRSRLAKDDGSERKLGIAALEDKIVQQAVATVMNAIYEEDFIGFSYGFRPGRNQHQALDALWVGLTERPINHVVDMDIQGFFDHLDHQWLIRFIEHRIADKRIIRLIRKWLCAGVIENGEWEPTDKGSPQGSVISPLLANMYLHYALDLWVRQRRDRQVRGAMIVVRYADDVVLGFQREEQAKSFLRDVEIRLKKFGLRLHPEKTRLIEFGRHAAARRRAAGLSKPETFNFLGFTHIGSKTRKGRFTVRRKTIGKRQQRKLQAIKRELRRRFQAPVPETGRWLRQVLQGYFQYYAVPYNLDSLNHFRYVVARMWLRSLRRRSQKGRRLTWEKFKGGAIHWLPVPRILHPWPNVRFRRRYPRQEPHAVMPHVGICAGGAP